MTILTKINNMEFVSAENMPPAIDAYDFEILREIDEKKNYKTPNYKAVLKWKFRKNKAKGSSENNYIINIIAFHKGTDNFYVIKKEGNQKYKITFNKLWSSKHSIYEWYENLEDGCDYEIFIVIFDEIKIEEI